MDGRMKRRMMKLPATAAAIVFALAAWPALAIGPGLGIGGDAKLHPYLDLDVLYNSNVNDLATGEIADVILSVHPGLNLTVPSEWIRLDLGGKVGYSRYFGIESKELRRNVVTGDADVKLAFNPEGRFQVEISDAFNRTEEPRDYTANQLAGRFSNSVKALLIGEPGGRALRLSAGYGFSFDYYDESTGLQSGNRESHNFFFDTRWRFLPKNSLLIHFDMALLEYPEAGGNFSNADAKPLRASLGLTGLITRTLSFRLYAGYGDSLVESGDSFRSAIAQVALAQKFDFGLTLSGGYKRDFQPTTLFRYYNEDKVFLKLDQALLDGDLIIDLGFEYAFVGFGKAPTPEADPSLNETACGVGSREDHRLRLRLGLGYNILEYLSVRISYGMDTNISDFAWRGHPVDPSGNTIYSQCIDTGKVDFLTHKTFLSVVFHY